MDFVDSVEEGAQSFPAEPFVRLLAADCLADESQWVGGCVRHVDRAVRFVSVNRWGHGDDLLCVDGIGIHRSGS
jgi:hypothetical protein